MTRRRRAPVAVLVMLSVGLGFGASAAGEPPAARAPRPPALTGRPTAFRSVLCTLRPGQQRLPAAARRGLAWHLDQYPTPSLATSRQRTAAVRLLAVVERLARRWRDPRRAAADGYDTDLRRARARDGVRAVAFLHAERRRTRADSMGFDPRRPKAVIYANVRGRPLQLVGVMYAMPRGRLGPNPGGPLTRWHWHEVCARGAKRGLTPAVDGSCPAGTTKRQGSEMMHVWLTGDLRSAFAIHAPEPELCRAGLLGDRCRPPGAGG